MTAEMVVMNRSAIALAADSAVTITSASSSGSEVRKIYANANKLFELIRGQPVGIMIYNSADFVQVPWETLVKVYRGQRSGISFPTAAQYVEDFFSFLRNNFATLIPSEARKSYFELTVSQVVATIISVAEQQVDNDVKSGKHPRATAAVRKSVLDGILRGIEGNTDPVSGWAVGLTEKQVIKDHGTDLLHLVPERMQGTIIAQTMRARTLFSAVSLIIRSSESLLATTGLVIAGFGSSEVFPSAIHVRVGGIFANRLVVSESEVLSVSPDQPSIIRPFAQTAEAATFLFGIDPVVKKQIEVWWRTWLTRLGPDAKQIVAREAPSLDDDSMTKIRSRFETFGQESWKSFADFMNELHSKLRYGPIEASAAFLSKSEIAGLAENMVNLASLRNRVSIDRDETVGGATDVAVISPGDGFVWIKRKHYFDQRFNPTWASRQCGFGVASEIEGVSEGEPK